MLTSAVQHGQCFGVLALLLPFIATPDAYTKDTRDKMEKTTACATACLNQLLGKKEPGERVKNIVMRQQRAMMAAFRPEADGEVRRIHGDVLATILVALTHMIAEVRITCPAWAYGECWFNLDKAAEWICRYAIDDHPEAEEKGVELYERLTREWEAA